MKRAASNYRVWALFTACAACSGIDLVMNGNLATYVQDEFGKAKGLAGLIAGLCGFMNLFARSAGGMLSDFCSRRWGMRGRMWALFCVFVVNAGFLILFSKIRRFEIAVPVLFFFSATSQMAEGCTFSVVPFVDPEVTGAIAGIVGAGGNVGAVIGNIVVKQAGKRNAFFYLGFCILAITLTLPIIHFPALGSMFFPASNKSAVVEEGDQRAGKEDINDYGEKMPAEPAPVAV